MLLKKRNLNLRQKKNESIKAQEYAVEPDMAWLDRVEEIIKVFIFYILECRKFSARVPSSGES